MTRESAAQDHDAWTDYWSSGTLHSCATSYGGNYGGAILAFWERVLQRAAGTERVLDLATGNGALARLVYEQTGGVASVDGVDAAGIDPSWAGPEERGRVRFHPGVRLESLPFPDASFDLVVSQFGLEYAHWPAAPEEAGRVCTHEGTMAFVLHHRDSVIVQVGRQEIANIAMLSQAGGLLPAAKGILEWIASARTEVARGGEHPRMANARLAYNAAMQRLSEALQGNRAPDLLLEARQSVHALVRRVASGAVSASDAERSLERLAEALAASGARTTQMLECALDEVAVVELQSILSRRRRDAPVEVTELRQPEGLLGWGVALHAPSASST